MYIETRTAYLLEVLSHRTNIHVYMHKAFLLAFPVRTIYLRVHEGMLCSQRHACYELVIFTLMCVNSYMICYFSDMYSTSISAVPVWWIKTYYYSSKNFKYIYVRF